MKAAAIFALLLVSISIFYYFVIFLPQQNQAQLEQKVQMKSLDTYMQVTNQKNLEACLNQVNQRYANMPTGTMGRVTAAEAKVILDALFKAVKESREECYKKFPTK